MSEIEELKTENERLRKVAFQSQNAAIYISQQADKYFECLQEIKRILNIHKQELEECLHNDIDGKILGLIIKAENKDEIRMRSKGMLDECN